MHNGAANDETIRGRVLYSVGYEGRTVEDLINTIISAGVRIVLDVRLNPVSRKPGLSKRKLAMHVQEAGMDYLHEPLLGNPPDNREGFRDGRPFEARTRFAQQLAGDSRGALLKLVEQTRTHSVALLCYESDESRCHRQVISEAAQQECSTLVVVPL